MSRAVDAFSGAGGWCLAARDLGLDVVGIETDDAACATREAAGLATVQADVTALDPAVFAPCSGLIASPPCPDFSVAGRGAGLKGKTGPLVHEVMRWFDALRPEWVACEQVPPVLPIWRAFAVEMRRAGYSVWTGVLDAASYGVPQNRKRAILVASRTRTVQPPEPTHCQGGREAGMFGPALLPFVSMAEALGWGLSCTPSPSVMTSHGGGIHGSLYGGSNSQRALQRRMADPEQWTGARLSGLKLHTSNSDGSRRHPADGGSRRAERETDRPAPTVDTEAFKWKLSTPGRSYGARPRLADPVSDPAPTLALGHKAASWCWDRPATTVQGDPRVSLPGHHERQQNGAVRVKIEELAVLQDFPADYPWQGNQEERCRQIGNAIPPGFARAILRALV